MAEQTSADAEKRPRGGRGQITAEARQKGALAKVQRGIFNKYIKALQGRAVENTRARIAEIDEMLSRGTRLKKAPVFEGGKRVGTVEKPLPLLPSERATWMAKRAKLEVSVGRCAPPELRARFLEMLPDYAARNELTREILLAVGVPEEDLDEVNL